VEGELPLVSAGWLKWETGCRWAGTGGALSPVEYDKSDLDSVKWRLFLFVVGTVTTSPVMLRTSARFPSVTCCCCFKTNLRGLAKALSLSIG